MGRKGQVRRLHNFNVRAPLSWFKFAARAAWPMGTRRKMAGVGIGRGPPCRKLSAMKERVGSL